MIELFGVSIPLAYVAYIIWRSYSLAQEEKEYEKLKQLSPEELDRYQKDHKAILEEWAAGRKRKAVRKK